MSLLLKLHIKQQGDPRSARPFRSLTSPSTRHLIPLPGWPSPSPAMEGAGATVTTGTIWGPAPFYSEPICWHDNQAPDPDAQSPSLGSAKNILHWLPCPLERGFHRFHQDLFPTKQQVWDTIPGIRTHNGNETGSSAPQSPKVGLKEAQREKRPPPKLSRKSSTRSREGPAPCSTHPAGAHTLGNGRSGRTSGGPPSRAPPSTVGEPKEHGLSEITKRPPPCWPRITWSPSRVYSRCSRIVKRTCRILMHNYRAY